MRLRPCLTLLLILGALLGPAWARDLPKGVAWVWEFDAPVSAPPVLHGDGGLIITGNTAQFLKNADGSKLWTANLSGECRSDDPPILVGNLAILPPSGGEVIALDLASGAQVWSAPARQWSPRLCAGRVLLLDGENLQALDPRTGQARWRLSQAKVRDFASHGSRLLYTTGEQIGVVDLASGQSLWRETCEEIEDPQLGPSVALSSGEDLVARDPGTGRRLWKLPKAENYTLLGDTVVASSYDSSRAISARSGQKLWEHHGWVERFAAAGPHLIASSNGGPVSLLDRRTGREMRSLDAYFPPLESKGQLLLGGRDGNLYRLDPRSAKMLPGQRGLWAPSSSGGDGARGASAKGIVLLPAGKALVALGEGPGLAHLGGAASVKVRVQSPQTPGKIDVALEHDFSRQVSLTVYRWTGGSSETLDTATPGAQVGAPMVRKGLAGAEPRYDNLQIVLKEPGTYLLEARAGNARARDFVIVTPMGVTVKLAPGQLLVQTLDLVRHVPLPGVTVELMKLGVSVSPGLSGVTDAGGTLLLPTELQLDQPLKLNLQRGAESVPFAITPEPFPGSDKIFLQTDRPLYRPGHEVFFKGLAASGDGSQRQVLKGQQVTVEVRDSLDNALLSQQLTSDEWGCFSGSLKLTAEPPLGRYRVSANLPLQQAFHLAFEVQEYRKPPFEVALQAREALVKAGQPISFDLKASYYFGGPVPNASVKFTVRRATLTGKPSPGYPGYHSYADYVSEETVTLGPDGAKVLQIATEAGAPDAEYLVDVEVTGPSGQVVEGSASALASASRYGVYLSSSDWLATSGKPFPVSVETLDRLGRPQPATVTLEVQKGGRAWSRVSRHEVKTGANGQTTFSWTAPKNGGYFRLLAFSQEPGLAGRELDDLYVSVYSSTPWATEGLEPSLKAERETYAPGQTAKLLLELPKGGPALLTVEGDRIYQSRPFVAKAGAQILTFPVEAGMAPGVTAAVLLDLDGELVSRECQLAIPDSQHKLNLEIRSDKPEYRPGETALLELRVTDLNGQPVDADASLAVVDESLFALRPDQVPTLHPFFFGPRDNRVQTFTLEPYRSEVAGFQTVPTPTRVRKDFKDTAFWQPSVLVSEGKAKIAVPLPDNLTRWRATSRASTADLKVGQSLTTFTSNLPLMVQAILPRFLVEGDAVDMLAIISNRSQEPQTVEVKLAANPGELERKQERVSAIPPDGQARVESRLTVEETVLGKTPLPSRLEVQVEARSAATPPESDAEQISVPILAFGQPYVLGKSNMLKAGGSQEERLNAPRALLKPKLEIRVAGSPLAALQGALDYLADFPYGCVEQTMSRFLPTVVAAQAMSDLGLFSEKRKAELAPMVEKGLAILYGYQHSDGGWGWWEYDETDPYMTGYVISGLAMARQAGYTISQEVLNRGIGSANYQLGRLDETALETRVYLAWALSVAGKPPLEAMGVLSALPLKNLSTYSVAQLALAWQSAGRPSEAMPLVEELERRAQPSGTGTSFSARSQDPYGWTDDEISANAYGLRAVVAAKPESELAPRVVVWLMAQRQGAQWQSTRDTANVVLALLDFTGHQKPMTHDGSLALSWDGNQLASAPLGGEETVVSVPAEQLSGGAHTLELRSSGAPAIYSYTLTGFVKEKEQVDLPGQSEGLRLLRTYVVEQPGQLLRFNRVTPPEILNVPSGQELDVELELDLPARMQYLKLEDPRPAGFEVIEGTVAGVSAQRVENRDAFTAFFFSELPAGKHTLTYRMRAETPGEYRSLPARLELMYQPTVFGATPSQRVVVRRASAGAAQNRSASAGAAQDGSASAGGGMAP